ncbi:hypothetical protein ACKFKF_03405 [Phormidesmis sp. 146-12]
MKIQIVAIALLSLGFAPEFTLSAPSQPISKKACSAQVEPLVTLLLRDLPGYANRVATRSTRRSAIASMNFVLTAGRPEFTPLPLKSGTDSPPDSDLQQVFLTTLERQNSAGKPFNLQQHHWLFLAKTTSGWRLALMFTRTRSASDISARAPIGEPITPPRESSQGIIGQAVQIWLRDCNAGAIKQ